MRHPSRPNIRSCTLTHGAPQEAAYASQVTAIVEGATSLAPEARFEGTFLKLANADGHAALASGELTLPALVSGSAETRAAATEAKQALQNMWAATFMRQDLFAVLKSAEGMARDPEEARLVACVMARFKHNGAVRAPQHWSCHQ